MQDMEKLRAWVSQSERIVFFGGAGVSTESGIPDFRGVDGLYRQKYDQPPEVILSADYFYRHTDSFYRFYRDKMLVTDAQPNAAHKWLAQKEREGTVRAVITQNIDGLHQKAGSKNVFELHGSIYKNRCVRCNRFYETEYIVKSEGVPKCECGGVIKPEVVLYGESLDAAVLEGAIDAIMSADLLIVGGTSLAVYPAAGLIDYYRGGRLALINKTSTARDVRAGVVLRKPIGEVFAAL